MANFKIGQRVRIIGTRFAENAHYLGRESVITNLPGCSAYHPAAYEVELIDDECYAKTGLLFGSLFLPQFLVPLADPKADAFIESIKNLKPYEEPVREPERERTFVRVKTGPWT
jgi:hypothetical protein